MDSTAVLCIADSFCLNISHIVCTVIGGILVGIFNHFMGLHKKKKELDLEDANKIKWLRNTYFTNAKKYFYDFASNMTQASITANMPNQNQNIEEKLSAFFEFKKMIMPYPSYIKEDEAKELFEYAHLMDAYILNLKYMSGYSGDLDAFQRWDASNPQVDVMSPMYQHWSSWNQANIDKFTAVSNLAQKIKQDIIAIQNNGSSLINKKII